MKEMEQQLALERTKYLAELGKAEDEFKQLRHKVDRLRLKITAIDTLLGDADEAADQTSAVDADQPATEAASDSEIDGGIFTPVQAYWQPILKTIVEMGGRGRREKIIEAVGKKMSGILTAADYDTLSDGNVIRWRNRVAWQASNMRARGFIKNDSPRGIWEITDDGRKWLDDKNA